MNESLLSPIELDENPELASLRVLATSLDVAQLALLATHRDICEPSRSQRPRCELEAYALSIIYQTDALGVLLQEYTESVRRSRERHRCEPPPNDEPF